MSVKTIGVLDIQGSKEEHFSALGRLKNVKAVLVKNVEDLEKVDALIIPGGESTTIGKLLRRFGLRDEIIKRGKSGMAIYGTCAGAILLAKKITGKENADSLGLMDIEVSRNAYGGQLDSFETEVKFNFGNYPRGQLLIPAVFIRAPKIISVGKGVEILARYGDEIVAAKQGNLFVTTFHPEMTEDKKVYEYFVRMIN